MRDRIEDVLYESLTIALIASIVTAVLCAAAIMVSLTFTMCRDFLFH